MMGRRELAVTVTNVKARIWIYAGKAVGRSKPIV